MAIARLYAQRMNRYVFTHHVRGNSRFGDGMQKKAGIPTREGRGTQALRHSGQEIGETPQCDNESPPLIAYGVGSGAHFVKTA